jgi:hypothetical protein
MKNKALRIICLILCSIAVGFFLIPYIHGLIVGHGGLIDAANNILGWYINYLGDKVDHADDIGTFLLIPILIILFIPYYVIALPLYIILIILSLMEYVYILSGLLTLGVGWFLGWFILSPIFYGIYKIFLLIGAYLKLGICLAFYRDGLDMTNEDAMIRQKRARIVLVVAIVCAVGLTSASIFVSSFSPYTSGHLIGVSQNYYYFVSSNIVGFLWKFINFTIHHWKPTHSITLNVIIGIFHVVVIVLSALLWLIGSLIFSLLMMFVFLTIYLIPWCFTFASHWVVNDVFRSYKAAAIVAFIFLCLTRLGIMTLIVYFIGSVGEIIAYREESATMRKYQGTMLPTAIQFPDVPQDLAETILNVLQNKNNDTNFIRRSIQSWFAHADSERTKRAVRDMVEKLGVVKELYDAAFEAEMSKYRYDNINKAKDVYDATLERDKKKF